MQYSPPAYLSHFYIRYLLPWCALLFLACQQQAPSIPTAQQDSDSAQHPFIYSLPGYTDDTPISHNIVEQIWQHLSSRSREQLRHALNATEIDLVMRGWLELAILSRYYYRGSAVQNQALYNWRNRWPQHPASLNLPNEIKILQTQQAAKNIALLLPTQGRVSIASKAIINGFMAAYYMASTSQRTATQLRIVQREPQQKLPLLIQQLANEHIDVIIGPLAKTDVAEVCQLKELSVPVIALNNSVTCVNPPPHLFRLSLNIQDDITQLIERLTTRNMRRLMLVVYDQPWANKIGEQFAEQWTAQYKRMISYNRFTAKRDLTKTLKSALYIQASEQRTRRLQRRLMTTLQNIPRRRKDIHAIVLIMPVEQARFAKPVINFFHADDIPVYSLSDIYGSGSQQQLDQDLNDIRFPTAPWLLNAFKFKKEINIAFHPIANTQSKFMALGIDIFWLTNRLNLMLDKHPIPLYGANGKMTIDEQGIVHRQLDWAIIQNGTPVYLTLPDDVPIAPKHG